MKTKHRKISEISSSVQISDSDKRVDMKQGWKIKKLGNMAEFSQGIQVVLKEQITKPKKGYVRFIRIVDYTQNTNDIRYVKNPGNNYFVNEDDIVMVRYGSPGLVGRGKRGVIANNLFKITIINKEVSNNYLSLYLSQYSIQLYLSTQGSSTMPALTFGHLKKVDIKYPSIEEQERIVAKLDQCFKAIDNAKANVERNLQNAKELFQSQLSQIFTKKGDDWVDKKLGEICTKISDGVHKKPNYVSYGIPFITIKNLTEGDGISFENINYITKEEHKLFCKRTKPEKGDILITKDGTIGIVRVVEIDIEFSIFVSVALIKPISKKLTPYLKYVLMSPIIQNQIKPKGTALKHLYLKDLREFLIPIPPLIEQKKIVFQLDKLSTQTKTLESNYQQELDVLDELKKSILEKSYSGELV